MRQSKLFTKTRRQAPADEVAKNAQLLIRAGFIHKELAGVYSYLPLGLRVLEKINAIIRREMNALGGQEVLLSALQDPEIWQRTGRFSDDAVDIWFKTRLKNDTELGLAFTHEEPLTRILSEQVSSYRDLPLAVYQLQTKFRNETRAKSGLIRGREFLMKDLYSFHIDEADLDAFYEKVKHAYHNIFAATGIGDATYLTFASGGVFAKYSHEFQALCEAGEDTIHVSEDKKVAVNQEVFNDEVLTDLGLKREELKERTAIEVGNIFKLGTRFSAALGLNYLDADGNKKPAVMGSYGLGPGRLMGTVAEIWSDDKGLVWPKTIAPFAIHLLALAPKAGGEVATEAEKLYRALEKANLEVLFDDRDARPGEKFADGDLLGLPYRVVISEKTLAEGKLELKDRQSGEVKMVSEKELLQLTEDWPSL